MTGSPTKDGFDDAEIAEQPGSIVSTAPAVAAAGEISNASVTWQPRELRVCAICGEHKRSIHPLMSRCTHLAGECLLLHYLDRQIKDPAKFPLQCFWPGCHRAVQDAQIRRIIASNSEMGAYYQQESRYRALRREARRQAAQRAEEQARVAKVHARRIIWNLRWQETCIQCGTTHVTHSGPMEKCGRSIPVSNLSQLAARVTFYARRFGPLSLPRARSWSIARPAMR